MTIDEGDLKPGDKVIVTRLPKGETTPTRWEGVIISAAGKTGGFELKGRIIGGNDSWSYFSDAETVLRMYGCIQTVTRAD